MTQAGDHAQSWGLIIWLGTSCAKEARVRAREVKALLKPWRPKKEMVMKKAPVCSNCLGSGKARTAYQEEYECVCQFMGSS